MKQCVKPCAGDWTPQEACKAWQTVPQDKEMPELLLKVEGALSKGNHFFIPKGIAKGGGGSLTSLEQSVLLQKSQG